LRTRASGTAVATLDDQRDEEHLRYKSTSTPGSCLLCLHLPSWHLTSISSLADDLSILLSARHRESLLLCRPGWRCLRHYSYPFRQRFM
jgi:hypothetical protein